MVAQHIEVWMLSLAAEPSTVPVGVIRVWVKLEISAVVIFPRRPRTVDEVGSIRVFVGGVSISTSFLYHRVT
jgi:hypothetical protein